MVNSLIWPQTVVMWPCCPFYSRTLFCSRNSSQDCYIPVLYCAGPGVFTYVSQNPITACGTCRPPTFCTENRATPPGWWLLRKHQSERQGVLTCDLPVNGCITTLLPSMLPSQLHEASLLHANCFLPLDGELHQPSRPFPEG